MLVADRLEYRRGLRDIIVDVSLNVARGEAVALLGPNGAGKTSTFQMLIGLIRPDSGSIFLDEKDITRMPIFERARRGLNYLHQQPSVFGTLTVEQNILLVLEAWEPDSARRKQIVEELLAQCGLTELRRRTASTLSGGELKRCEIARLLSTRPSIVLLDEPFAKLDPVAIEHARSIIQDLKQGGVGVLVTDHNIAEALASVDRAYLIDSGRIVAAGGATEIRWDGKFRSLFSW